MRSSKILIAVSLVALVTGCDLMDPARLDGALAGPRPVAHLEMTRGQVSLERAGKKLHAVLGYLMLRDALETSASGGATVRLGGGRVVEVGPDARFVIGEDGNGLVLEVARGLVLSRIPGDSVGGIGTTGGASVSLSIMTPFGITRVGNGNSELSIDVGAADAKVNVLVGSVEFVSRNGQPTAVNAGESVSLTAESIQILGRNGKSTTGDEAATAAGGIELQPIDVVVFASSGKVELKKKDAKKWSAVTKTGDKLADGDALRVKDGRSLVSLASGSQLWLENNSEAVFAGSGKAGDLEDTKFDLKKGAMTLTLAPNQKSHVTLGALQLQSDLGGQFGVQMTKDGVDVSAVAGDVKVLRNGVEQIVQAGQIAHLGAEGTPAKLETEEAAELVLPSKSGMKVFHGGIADAAVSWIGPPERTYFVEVALDAAFSDKIIAGRVHSNFLNVSIPRKGNLYWRVFQEDAKTSVGQGSAYFAPEAPQKDLARLRNEVPEGTEKTTIYYQDKPPAVTFTYKPEEKATQYRVVVFKADALDAPVADRTVGDPSVALEAGALVEGSYVWSVTPISDSGEELRGGKMNKLELVYDNSTPSLQVKAPRNGDAATGSTTHVSGVAPVGTKLYVQGKLVDLDEKNRFEADVPVSGKPPQVVFRLSQPNAADSFTVRSLKRSK